MSAADKQRFDYLEGEIKKLNDQLAAEHEAELEEIRRGKDAAGFQAVGYGQAETLTPLFSAFNRAGFKPGEGATEIEFNYRTLTWSGSVDSADIASE